MDKKNTTKILFIFVMALLLCTTGNVKGAVGSIKKSGIYVNYSNPERDSLISNYAMLNNNLNNELDKKPFWPWWMYRKNGVGKDKYGRAREVSWSWSDIGEIFKLGITFEAVDYTDLSDHIDEDGYLSGSFIGRARAAGYYYNPSSRYKK